MLGDVFMTSTKIDKTNSSNILETAKKVITQTNNSPSNKYNYEDSNMILDKDAQKLALINKTIIKVKEFLKFEIQTGAKDILKNLKKYCLTQKIFFKDQLKNINSGKELLDALHVLRKNTKLCLFNKTTSSIELSASSQSLLNSNSEYTLSKLCKEFSCNKEKINNEFIENKKALCFSKVELLLSQHNYCNILFENIEELNEKNGYKLEKKDLPNINEGLKFTFDQMCELAENTLDDDLIDLNKNTLVLGTLSHFKSKIVKEIDKQCQRIDLVNTYLSSLKKTQNIEVGLVSER